MATDYGYEHRKMRAHVAKFVALGNVTCCLCGDPITPGSKWHLDHTIDRTAYRGAAHAHCNTSDGATRGNAQRAGKVRRLVI